MILIPCYNTHKYINDLISQIRLYTNKDILVFDDGSSPSIKLDSEYDNIHILRSELNKGKGKSLIDGFKYAKNKEYTHVITMDGDLQHSPDDVDKFINAPSNFDFVLGSRQFKKPMPLHRMLSNYITSFIVSIFVNAKIMDSQCGFRRYKIDSLNLTKIDNPGYLYETEILLDNSLNSENCKNINIKTIYSDSISNINNIRDTFRFINVLVRHIIA